jgi:amylosucrase
MRMVCEIVCPGTLLLGEVVMEPSKVVPYFGTVDKPECHLLYNVTTMATLWHTVATKDVRLLAHQMRQVFSLPHEYSFLNYLRCHDDIGWGLDYGFLRQFCQEEVPHKRFLNDYLTGKWEGSPARGELCGEGRIRGTAASLCGVRAARGSGDREAMERALQLDRMLHALIFTLSGIPVIYGGDETAAENSASGEGADGEKAALRRKKNTPESRMFAAVRQLGKLRREHAAFDTGADTWLPDTGNLHVLGIGRYFRGEQLLAFFNFSDQPQEIWIGDDKIYRDLVSGEETDAVIVPLESGSFRWLMHTF